jgi:hypothetical protein
MDIITNYSNETFYKIDNAVAAVLISCGLVRQVTGPAKAKETYPEWSVCHPPSGRVEEWCIRRCVGGSLTYFGGDVSKAKDGFKTLLWNGAEGKHTLQGPEPPTEILEQFARFRGEDAEANRLAEVAAERRRNPQTIDEARRRLGKS